MVEEIETVKSSLIFPQKSELQPAFEGLGATGETAPHSQPFPQLIRNHIFNNNVTVCASFLRVFNHFSLDIIVLVFDHK